MASKTIEARLVISGEDRASSEIAKVVKAFKDAEKAAGFSDKLTNLGKAYGDVERQMRAVGAVMSARGPLEATVKNLATAQQQTARLAKEYDTARKAVDDFTKAQKVAKTADGIQQAAALSAEVKRVGAAHKAAESDVRRLSAAFSAQTTTLRSAEAAASKLGADLSSLERHQAGLVRQTDLATRALKAQIAAEEAAGKAAEARASRTARRKDAAGTIMAGAGVIAAHRGKEIGIEAIDKAASFDYAKRYQVVAGGVSEQAQRTKLLPQALRIGQETKFTNEDIVEAQTTTMQGLPMKGDLRASVTAAIVENVKNYAVMMRAPMESSAQGIRSFLQTSQKDISTEEKAIFEAKRASNLLVKMAKLGGMKDNDVQDFINYGIPTGTAAGLSDTTLAALGAAGKRSGLGGAETGVFVRAAASKLVAPTIKGMDALTAAGIDYNKFTKMPEAGLSVKNLESFSKRRFGKDFTEDQRNRLRDLLEDGEVVGNKDEFTKQVSQIVSEGFDKTKKGKTKAQDSQKIAKMVGDFHKLSTENVNSEALLDEILSNPKMTIALRNAFFTDKHGGKASTLSSQYEQFGKDREELKNLQKNDPDFVAKAAKYMADGLGGSIDNLKGSYETLVLNIGTANAGLIQFAAEGIAKGTDMFSNLSQTSQQVLSLVGGGAAVAGGVYGAGKLAGKLFGFGGGAVALNGSAVALNAAAAALTEAAILQGAKGAAPAAAPAAAAAAGGAATFGILGTGVIAGAYLDSQVTNGAGELQANRDLWEKLTSADKAGAALGYQTPRGKRPLVMPGASARAPVTSSFRVDREGWFDNFLNGPRTDTFELPGFGGGRKMAIPTEAREAGQKAGEAIKQGLSDKAPEVEQQGRAIYERIKEVFAQGINLPINFTPGEGAGGGGLISKASLGGGGGGLGGLIQRASLGGGGTGGGTGGGSGGSGGGGGGALPAIPSSVQMTDAERNTLGLILQHESHGKNVMNYVGRGQGLSPETAKGYTAQGYFQMLNSNWRRIAPKLGITSRNAMAGSLEDQTRVALYLLRNGGVQNWTGFNPALRNAIRRGDRARVGTKAPADEPKLVRGADGKEGLDLGNGTMKMPDGSTRPIPSASGLTIPEAPAGGFGGSGGSRGDMRAAAERMHDAADRMEGMGFHGQIQLAVTGSGRDSVRATGIRTRGRGGMSADLGISMPGAKESDGDWV